MLVTARVSTDAGSDGDGDNHPVAVHVEDPGPGDQAGSAGVGGLNWIADPVVERLGLADGEVEAARRGQLHVHAVVAGPAFFAQGSVYTPATVQYPIALSSACSAWAPSPTRKMNGPC